MNKILCTSMARKRKTKSNEWKCNGSVRNVKGSGSRKVGEKCIANTAKGTRCARKCYLGNMCWQHAMRDKGVRVCKSKVPGLGMGLVATRDFKGGEVIDIYNGEELSRSEIEKRYPGDAIAEYTICFTKKQCVDGRNTNCSFARYINDSRGIAGKENKVKFSLGNKCCPKLVVMPGKKIHKNEEIFVNYGKEYWKRT